VVKRVTKRNLQQGANPTWLVKATSENDTSPAQPMVRGVLCHLRRGQGLPEARVLATGVKVANAARVTTVLRGWGY